MKHFITLVLFLFLSLKLFAQTDGISYQAVIIGPDVLELPGVDSEGNYLPLTEVDIKFIIYDSGNQIEFQEVQTTTTDEFGRINLIIGAVEHDYFETISWDGTPKDLKVEIDFKNSNGFVDMSREQLTFVPYAYHRNITATGTLTVDDDTFLNRELTVNGPTTLNSTLLVNGENEANLTGDLTVDGETNLNNTLTVTGQSISNLSGPLNVGDPLVGPPDGDPNAPTTLNGSLTVVGESTFTGLVADDLTINNSTELNGNVDIISDTQVTITSTLDGDDDTDINSYPLKIEGGEQGLAIVVNESRTNDNNFISFWDNTASSSPSISGVPMTTTSPTMWGRIEGETQGEFGNNADYEFDKSSLDYDIYDGEIDLGFAIADAAIAALQVIKAATDFRGCFGLGGCLASPGPADIAFAAAEVISDGIQVGFATDALNRAHDNEDTYDANKLMFRGVTYASGAGDYAEYLQRVNLSEEMTYGDIVGVVGGKVSKNTTNAERTMVVSFKPIVLGNMPQSNEEKNYEKVAFMGQVPVKVYGMVNIGDYIIPSGKNDGIGIAVSPSKITSKDIKSIVGVAWDKSKNIHGFSMINVAVGLNTNDNNPIIEQLEKQVEVQAAEISDLKKQIADIHTMLSDLENGNAVSLKSSHAQHHEKEDAHEDKYDDRKFEIIDTDKGEVVYWEVTEEDFEKGLELAEEQMRLSGIDTENHILLKKIKSDPNYKKEVLASMKERLDQQFHYHKDIDRKGGH